MVFILSYIPANSVVYPNAEAQQKQIIKENRRKSGVYR
jgi:hypothetical protein